MTAATAFALVCAEHDDIRRKVATAREAGLLAPAVADVFGKLLDRHTPDRNDYLSVPGASGDTYRFHCPRCLLSFGDESTEPYPCHVVDNIVYALDTIMPWGRVCGCGHPQARHSGKTRRGLCMDCFKASGSDGEFCSRFRLPETATAS